MLEILVSACLSLYIYDGDNFRCNGTTYRLVGLDAPEIRGQCGAERRLARVSRDRLRALARHPTARLQEVLCHGSNFGRKCGIVTVNGKNVADTLVSERLANPFWCGSGGCPERENWCALLQRRPQ